MTSFWGNEYVDSQGIAHRSETGFEGSRIANAAFRVVNKTQERCAATLGSIAIGIDPELLGEVFDREAVARFFDEHCKPIVVQQKRRARGSFRITRGPFLRADIVKLDSQQRMQQILHIKFVFHGYRGSILPTKPQLPSDRMEPTTEYPHEFDRIRSGLRSLRCGLLVRGGAGRH